MKILVAMDGSPFSEAALAPVIKLSRQDTDIVLAHVLKPLDPEMEADRRMEMVDHIKARVDETGRMFPMPAPPEASTAVRDLPSLDLQRSQEMKEYLEEIAARFFRRNAKIVVHLGEDPAAEIKAIIDEEKPDLVALATHGKTGVASLLTGSVTRQLLQTAGVPLLLVRPEGL